MHNLAREVYIPMSTNERSAPERHYRGIPEYIQIGFPNLPAIGGHTYFKILRLWLEDCDAHHPHCLPDSSWSGPQRVPTRLIDVDENSGMVQLRDTAYLVDQSEGLKYIALSHAWGSPSHHRHFCTTRENIDDHLSNGIAIDKLPDTLKHAVKVTQELGVQYLWVDSLCIIQGRDGDFDIEAKHMETVYSSAYCVIAASCAGGSSDGFLKERLDGKFVKFEKHSESPFYVCQAIDSFQHDVIEGALNRRGWVLEQRALARRTIYFTEKQTYWECGEGVRCETLNKMRK